MLREAGIAQHQYRSDRRPLRRRPRQAGANRSTGSSASPPSTSPSTCSKSTKTAASARRCCSAESATAPPIRRREDADRRLLRDRRRAPGRARHPALRDLQLRAPRPRVAPQPEILDAANRTSASAPTRTPSTAGIRWAESRIGRGISRRRPDRRRPAPARPADERLFLGLRLTARHPPNREEWQTFAEPIRRFLDYGLLESHDGALRLTNRGVLLSNEVFQEFLTA